VCLHPPETPTKPPHPPLEPFLAPSASDISFSPSPTNPSNQVSPPFLSFPQDGKPYILSNESRRIANTSSPLSDGYTVISQTIFASWEDANYYDQECPAHMELKKTTGPKRTGVQTLIYESEVGVEGAAKL
jgi:hypothetical protein